MESPVDVWLYDMRGLGSQLALDHAARRVRSERSEGRVLSYGASLRG